MAKYRCGGCNLLYSEAKLTEINNDDFCPKCAKRWYVIRVGGEKTPKVLANIRKQIREYGMSPYVSRIVVPKTPKQQKYKGAFRRTLRTKYHGYVLIEMLRDFRIINVIEKAKGVVGFLPLKQQFFKKDPYTKKVQRRQPTDREYDEFLASWHPHCVESEEAAMVLIEAELPASKKKPCEGLVVGEEATVLQGPKRGMIGVVIKIDDESEIPTVWLRKELLGVPTVFKIPCWQMEA